MRRKIIFTAGICTLISFTIGAATGVKINAELKNQQISYEGNISNQGVITYKGTTYVPIRGISNILGIDINNKNDIIYLGDNVNKYVYLTDIKPYSISDFESDYLGERYVFNEDMIMGNRTYNKGIQLRPEGYTFKSIYYNLEEKYTKINGLVGLDDRDNKFVFDEPVEVRFYIDGIMIHKLSFQQGDLPKELNLNISNGKQLKIEVGCESNNHPYINLVDMKIQ